MTTSEFLDYLAQSDATRDLAGSLGRLVADRRRLDAYVAFHAAPITSTPHAA